MSLQSIQSQVFDESGALFSGQVADFGSAQNANIRTFVNESVISPGEGVVKGTLISENNHSIRTPYKIKRPVGGSDDADFVGIVMRSEAFIIDDLTNELVRRVDSLTSIAERGSGVIIGIPTTVQIAHDDDVYLSIDAAQSPNLPVGQFTNAAGAGVVLLTGSKWYGAAAANTVARIKL